MERNKIQENKGVAIVLTTLVLTAILAIAFGISGLILGELKMSKDLPKSLKAFYAAEAGIERKLDEIRSMPPDDFDIGSAPDCSDGGDVCLDSDTCYAVDVILGGIGDCPITALYCIKSYGCYKGVRRAIEISY